MSESPGTKTLFVPVDDLSEILSLLQEGARSKTAAMVWTHEHGQVIQTRLLGYDPAAKTLHIEIPADFDPRQFIELLLKRKKQECFISLSLPQANLFFSAMFRGTDRHGIKFGCPAKVFRVQRRADLRVALRDEESVLVEFEDPLSPMKLHSRPGLDVSSNGISILVTVEELELFAEGMVVPELTFKLQGYVISCSAEVRHMSRYQAADGKIGFRFSGLPFADAQFLATFVNNESRRQFSEFSQGE